MAKKIPHLIMLIAIAIVVVIILVIFVGIINTSSDLKRTVNGTTTNSESITTSVVSKDQGKVEIKSDQLQTANYQRQVKQVVGEVVNNVNRPVTYVKVTATFYDANNNVTDTNFNYAGSSYETPIEPNATASFKIMTENLKADHYKLDVSWN